MKVPFTNSPAAASVRAHSTRVALRFIAGCGLLALALLLPSRPFDPSVIAARAVPIELPAAIALLLVYRGRFFRAVVAAICVLAGLLAFLKLADIATFSALGRAFNPLLDLVIIKDGWNLLAGSVGIPEAALLVAAALFGWIGTTLLMAYGLTAAERIAGRTRRVAGGVVAAAVLVACLSLFAGMQRWSGTAAFEAGPSHYLVSRIALMRRTANEMAAFDAELAQDPLADLSGQTLFGALADRDVYVLFVESYGRTVLASPAYRSRIAPRLAAVESMIAKAGYEARSGWMTSPTVGGQSWLAHGALLAGLPTTDQNRYRRMIASQRPTLNRLFRQSGWRTVAIMPAITMDWPEGAYFGYDEIHDSDGLGYRGLPFNWVTMPDQYTLTAARRIVAASQTPVMVEAALISSHAPWTPIPKLVPWDAVGDGRIFDAQALSGETPAVVWAEPDRVRDHYLHSIDYALATIGEFIARFGGNAVFLVLGDHQPARLLTGDNATRDVPFHLIANDPAILARLAAMGLSGGMVPADDVKAMPMWAFREAFVRAMSDPARDPTGTQDTAQTGR